MDPTPDSCEHLPRDDAAAIEFLRQSQVLGSAEAVLWLSSLVSQAREAGRLSVLGHALCRLARSLNLADDTLAADQAAAEGLALFKSMGDTGGQVIARNAMAMVRFTRGDFVGALDLLQAALEQARPLGDASALFGLLNGLGVTLNAVGDPQAAAHAFEECLALTTQDPSDLRCISASHNLVMALARWAELDRDGGRPAAEWQPRAERAIAIAEATLAGAAAAGHRPAPAGLSNLALALLVAGHAERALAVVDRPEVRTAEGGSTLAALHLAQTRAGALIKLGRASDAVAVCEAALARASASKTELQTDMLWRTLSQAHEAAGDFKAALDAHRRFYAAHAHMVFERAEQSARALVPNIDLVHAQRESRIDPLTGIANRRGFEERVQARLSRVRSDEAISLMLIDVDHFKDVNDSLGHAAGDRLLCSLSSVLNSVCRGTEAPARLGGDEFVVVLDGGGREARALAERVRVALAQAAQEPGPAPHAACTVSIGLATTVGPCRLDELLANADRAMYAAKTRGRDRVATASDLTTPLSADL